MYRSMDSFKVLQIYFHGRTQWMVARLSNNLDYIKPKSLNGVFPLPLQFLRSSTQMTWGALFRHEVLSRDPLLLAIIPKYLRACMTNLVKVCNGNRKCGIQVNVHYETQMASLTALSWSLRVRPWAYQTLTPQEESSPYWLLYLLFHILGCLYARCWAGCQEKEVRKRAVTWPYNVM